MRISRIVPPAAGVDNAGAICWPYIGVSDASVGAVQVTDYNRAGREVKLALVTRGGG